MKRAVIFLHGDKPSKKVVTENVKKSDRIICADGGTMHAVSCGLKPDVYVGDLDSISPALYKKSKKEKIEWHIYDKEKNYTDSELAIEYAIKKGFRKILIFGLFGSRLDHMIANLSLFAEKIIEGVQIKAIVEEQHIYFCNYKLVLSGKIGDYLSLLPLKDDVKGVTTKGLKWRLYNDTLYFGKTLGISNEFIEKKVEVQVSKGILMVIHTKR